MKRLIMIALIFLLFFTGFVRAGTNYYWVKSCGGSGDDAILDVKVLPDRSIIAVSYSSGDALVMRVSPDGKVEWTKTYDKSGEDVAEAVALAKNGDITVADMIMEENRNLHKLAELSFEELRKRAERYEKWAEEFGG